MLFAVKKTYIQTKIDSSNSYYLKKKKLRTILLFIPYTFMVYVEVNNREAIYER